MKKIYPEYPTQAAFNRAVTETLNLVVDRFGLSGVRTVTSDFTANNEYEVYLIDAVNNDVIATLPPAASYKSKKLILKRIDVSGYSVTINAVSTNLIDGSASEPLTSFQSARLYSDGSHWYLV